MNKARLFIFLFISASMTVSAQETEKKAARKEKKGYFYFNAGSHRAFYTPSDIHVQRGGAVPFNFTLEHVKAADEGGLKWDTAPQFSYNIGYYFTKKKFGLEYQYDHAKYFVRQDQRVRLKGVINGKEYDQDTTLIRDFFQMEHSDGANFCMFNFVKWFSLKTTKDEKFNLSLILKGGLGFVNPKTNTTIMGEHRDDKYHLAGYIVGMESGLKLLFWKYFVVTGTFKGAYANYDDFLVAEGTGSHKFFVGQLIYMVGAQFPL